MSEWNEDDFNAVAIIGLTGRFPAAADVDALWQMLAQGGSGIRPVTAEMLREAGLDPQLALTPNYIPRAAWVDNEDCFDAAFFTIAPREAAEMDPQQRLLLECAYHALESAGYAPRQIRQSVGVYVGTKLPTYYINNLLPALDPLHSLDDLKVQVGADKSYAATRLAHALNLQGPALSVDTACSTSLVSVHLACRALIAEECDLALAGGANINVPQRVGYWYQEGGIQSSDGHCRAFDAQAAGTVFGNGVGLVVLKRLDDARRDGDNILAIIRGSAVNNDGADKVGFWAPGVAGQTSVIRLAQAMAGVAGAQIDYVEAHGTGTALGDPIEIAALSEAFADRTGTQHCAIASVKSNLGHLEVAAGITGLIKLVLALERAEMPPSVDFQRANPKIDFAHSPFYVNTALRPWPADEQGRRLAALSSFGIGGTNAHAIVEGGLACGAANAAEKNRSWRLWPFSAMTQDSVQSLGQQLMSSPLSRSAHAGDVAFTLQQGRERLRWRSFCLAAPADSAGATDSGVTPGSVLPMAEPCARIERSRPLRLAFLFPGQGSQYPAMLRGLWDSCRVFRAELETCFQFLRQWLDLDPQALWCQPQGEEEHPLYQTRYAQPMLFAVEYALARQWEAWGIRADYLLGHSLGEYVAACLAGVFELEHALHLLVQRGALCHASAPGAMFSVALDAASAAALCGDLADVAAINGERLTVLGVRADDSAALIQRLEQAQIPWRQLKAQRAFHSRLLKPHVDSLRQLLSQVPLQPPQRVVISNLSGQVLSAAEACDREYWVRHLLEPVQFAAGIQQLRQLDVDVVLEVGPGQVLSQLARVNGLGARQGQAPVVSSGHRPGLKTGASAGDDQPDLLRALGRLWQAGFEPDWHQVNQQPAPDQPPHDQDNAGQDNAGQDNGWRPRRVRLPLYPFQAQRHWRQPPDQSAAQSFVAGAKGALTLQPSLQNEAWQRLSLAQHEEPDLHEQLWLVFHDTLGYSADLAFRLRGAGARVIDVYDNRIHAMAGVDAHSIDPRQPADFSILLGRLREADLHPQGVIYAWGLSETTADSDTPFQALTSLGRALRPQGDFERVNSQDDPQQPQPPRLLLLHNHTAEVLGHEQLCPCKGMLPAAGAVLAQEYGLECCSVDIDIADEDERQLGGRRRRTVEQAFNLLIGNEPHWHHGAPLAIRGRYVWRREFTQMPRPEPYQGWRGRGVYLITGATRGIGRCFAEYVLHHVPDARLILLGRQEVSAASVQDCLAALARISASAAPEHAAELNYQRCDVANDAEFSALLEQMLEQYGEINGVLHSAGIAAANRLEFKSAASIAQVQGPKCIGSRVLQRQLRGQEALDWVLLNSSLLALGGVVGQYDYATANRYMDAIAAVARHHRIPMCSVNWDAWHGIGMLSTAAAVTDLIESAQMSGAKPLDRPGSVQTEDHAPWPGHPLLGRREAVAIDAAAEHPEAAAEGTANRQGYRYRQVLAADFPLLQEHQILGYGVLPNTAWVELAYALGVDLWGAECGPEIRIDKLEISQPLVLKPLAEKGSGASGDSSRMTASRHIELECEVLLTDVHSASVAVYSLYQGQQESERQLHCRFHVKALGHILRQLRADTGTGAGNTPQVELQVCAETEGVTQSIHLAPEQLPHLPGFDPLAFIDYGKLGTAWRSLERCHSDGQEVWSEHHIPTPSPLESLPFHYPAAALDAAAGLVNGAALLHHRATLGHARDGLFLPQRYASIVCLRPLPTRFTSHCRLHGSDTQHLSMDLDLRDSAGELLLRVVALDLVHTTRERFARYLAHSAQRNSVATTDRQRGRDTQRMETEGREEGRRVSQQAEATALLPGMITPAMAPSLFDQLLSAVTAQRYAQVAVCAGDVYQRLQQWRQRLADHLGEVTAEAGKTSSAAIAAGGSNTQLSRSENKGGLTREDLPVGAIEERIAQLWQELIGVEQVSRSANFFELGGHSLMATQMAARLRDEYAVEVPLEALFEEPTVAAMSALVQARLWAIRGTGATAQGGLGAAREEGVL